MHLYLMSRCCYGEAGQKWMEKPPGNTTWVKRDHGSREMFLWSFLLTQVACAGQASDPQGRAVRASAMQAGVTCPVPLWREGLWMGTEQSGQAGRGAVSGPEHGSSAHSKTSTDKELYPWLSPLHSELFLKKKKKFQAFWVFPCD